MDTQTEQHEGYQVVIEKPIKTEPTTHIELDIRKPKEKQKFSRNKKVLSVIESDPFLINSYRRYMMLTAQERQDIKQSNPELNVRLADKEETLENLCIRDDAMDEDHESTSDHEELNTEERLRNYRESMTWVEEFLYKCWVFHNKELLMTPTGKMLRWDWGDTPIPED